MAEILTSIRYNLRNLLRFSGRDPQGRFWPYAIVIFVLSMIGGFLVMIPIVFDMMLRIHRFALEDPKGLPPPDAASGMQALPMELFPDLSIAVFGLAAVNCATVLLLASAVARRLHDRNRTGLWGLLPLPFMLLGVANTRPGFEVATGNRDPGGAESLVFMTGPLFFWIALLILIVLLVGEGSKGPNRFGPDPLAS